MALQLHAITLLSVLSLCAAVSPAIARDDGNVLADPSFDLGSGAWSIQSEPPVQPVIRDGTLQIAISDSDPVGWPLAYQSFDAVPEEIFTAGARVRQESSRDGYGAYIAIDFRDENGERISYTQSPPAFHDNDDWQWISVRAMAPEGTRSARISCIVHGRGKAWFDSAEVRRTGTLPARHAPSVTLSRSSSPPPFTLYGFGFEDDGWFHGPDNAERGVTEVDAALREARIRWMQPDLVRMFFWIKDWCPDGDWENFTFDSPNMESHYRALTLYQELGARVIVTGVEWGLRTPYADTEKAAQAIVTLFDHLVNIKGFTCVRAWTLTNEPDIGWFRQGGSFDSYVRIHRLVRDGIEQRNLDIAVVGSDDALGLPWFQRTIEHTEYRATVDWWSSHTYFRGNDRWLAGGFFSDRTALMQTHGVDAPLLVTEFGFQDERSTHAVNPLMSTYDYALWTAAFAVEGLNHGVRGFSIWCLHAMQYPGVFMNYGLWGYKDDGWTVRPVYHAWAMFCRHTTAGDMVMPWQADPPGIVHAVQAGKTMFWVNVSDSAVDVQLEGVALTSTNAFMEEHLEGDRDSSIPIPVRSLDKGKTANDAGSAFRAPPRSFGYAAVSY